MNPENIGHTFQVLLFALLAILGASARQMQQTGFSSLMSFFSGCFISSFTGILIYFIAGYLGMDINLACALSGICGWIGPQALDAFSTSLLKIANLGSLPESVPNQRPKQED